MVVKAVLVPHLLCQVPESTSSICTAADGAASNGVEYAHTARLGVRVGLSHTVADRLKAEC